MQGKSAWCRRINTEAGVRKEQGNEDSVYQGTIYQDWLLNENRYFKLFSMKKSHINSKYFIIGNLFRPKFSQSHKEKNFIERMPSSPEALYFCRIRMDGSIAFCSRVKTHSYAFLQDFLSKAYLHSSSPSKNMASTNSQFLLSCLFFF